MKYGFLFSSYNDAAHIMYALQNFPYSITQNNEIIFSVGDDEFIFVRHNYEYIANCDKKILLCHADWKKDDTSSFDKIIVSFPGESIPTHVTDERLLAFLNSGNIAMSSGTAFLTHENFIFDSTFNLVYLYYFLGYNYLNVHDYNNEKTNLLGIYYDSVHISGFVNTNRDRVFNHMKLILGDDLHRYNKKSNSISSILEPYHFMGLWEKNSSSTYTDFVTSTCCFIFETIQTLENEKRREHITEKTLKGIVFSKANVFTIWCGSRTQYLYLREKGFWFLNFEFYDENLKNESRIENSIFDASKYLKDLKNKLGSDNKVHSYLIEKYGHKLKQNVLIFENLLNNYERTEYIISRIKN